MSEVEVPVRNLPEPESVYFVFEYINMDVAGCISWLEHDSAISHFYSEYL